MPRPRKCRKVCCLPKVSEFMPSGGASDEACVVMTVDEYETIRLIDKENFSQEECGKYMHIARTTVQQIYDSASGKYKVGNVKCVVRGVPKKTELGKFDVGTTTGTANTIETAYLKVTIDGETVLELDKFNYICNIGGVDYMADVREALGMV